MSMPRSRLAAARIEALVFAVAGLLVCGATQARQSDKNQPVHLNADTLVGSQQSGKLVVTGHVTLDQGTFHADGDKATGYTDPDNTQQWQRVVLTGSPAHFRQTQDDGTLAHGQAQTLDYKVSENTVILTGNASVTQEGRGSFNGARLVYNTDTGAIQGSATPGGRVHITLQPHNPPPASAKPASGSAPAAASSMAAPARSVPVPAPAKSVPAPASTAGTH